MVGHQNNKQKIHQHQMLKDELLSKEGELKAQREQLVQLTLDRNAARAELRQLKAAHNQGQW